MAVPICLIAILVIILLQEYRINKLYTNTMKINTNLISLATALENKGVIKLIIEGENDER